MAHTNSTPNYNLPQFLPTDKPAWLVDVNPAYASIDTAIKNASDAAGNAQTDATQALSDAAGANAIATQANSKADGAIASISEQFLDTATYAVGEYVIFNNILYVCTEPVTTPGPWTGSVNWTRASLDSIATTLNSMINNIDNKTGSSIPVSATDPTPIAEMFEPETITLSKASNIDTFDTVCTKVGKIVQLSSIFSFSSSPTFNQTIATNLPASVHQIQVPVYCVAGTNVGSVSRARITTSGTLTDWYSSTGFFKMSDTYMISTAYISAK